MWTLLQALLQRQWIQELFCFGVVGVLGFLVNTAAVYTLSAVVDMYAAGVLAFIAAASCTWFFNRHWTFLDGRQNPWFKQLRQFVFANFIGFLFYMGVYSSIIYFSEIGPSHPWIAVAGGSLAGLGINFSLSKCFVFGVAEIEKQH